MATYHNGGDEAVGVGGLDGARVARSVRLIVGDVRDVVVEPAGSHLRGVLDDRRQDGLEAECVVLEMTKFDPLKTCKIKGKKNKNKLRCKLKIQDTNR